MSYNENNSCAVIQQSSEEPVKNDYDQLQDKPINVIHAVYNRSMYVKTCMKVYSKNEKTSVTIHTINGTKCDLCYVH